MSEVISFPGMGLEFTLNRVAFYIGNFAIYWYGIIIAAAFLAGITYILYRVRRFGLDSDRVVDVILGGALGAIIGARLYFVVFSWDMYKDNLLSVFNMRSGGIAIYGAIIGGFLAGYIMCRVRNVSFLPMADLAVGGLILGQGIGRWGNYVNVEAFGGNTGMPWGMTSPGIQSYLAANATALGELNMKIDPMMPVHPTFFYESVWCLLGFAAIFFYTSRRRFDGELLLIYSMWYGLGRAFIEGLRTDSLLIGTLRVSQVLAILCVLVSGLIWFSVHSKIKRSKDDDYLKLYVNTEEGQMILSGTFYKKKARKSTQKAHDLGFEESILAQAALEQQKKEDSEKNKAYIENLTKTLEEDEKNRANADETSHEKTESDEKEL